MGLIVNPSACAVTIGGVAYPLAAISAAVDTMAPEVDSLTMDIPWGDRRISGASNPAETLPALGAEVVATCGSWTWRGLLTRRTRSAAGRRRFLSLSAHGPGLALDRSYLPSFARVGLTGVIQVPGGPRFAPGTMSASTTTVAGVAVRYLTAGGADWTVEHALASFIAHATAYAGLPAITIDAGSADLTRVLVDTDTDGQSVHAGLCAILGHRLGLLWRLQLTASGWVLRVRGTSGTGTAVDLTGGDVVAYDFAEDNSAALADLEVRGGRKVYVLSIDGKASGNLAADWTSGDAADRADGDRSSPAYRRFTLATFALPDGSPSTTADPEPSLPIAAEPTLAAGSSPWLAFAQLTEDSSWQSLQGKVSIAVGGGRIWIEGIDPAEWATWSRVRLTLALSPRAHLTATRTGGSGLGRGLAMVATRHAYASGAATRISGSSLASVTGSAISQQTPIDEEADALWDDLGGPQVLLSWTRDGIAGGGPEPGDRLTSVVLPVPGSTATTVAMDCLCTARRVSRAKGRMQTTWEAGPRPFATGALTR
jgi:hypothetical protein